MRVPLCALMRPGVERAWRRRVAALGWRQIRASAREEGMRTEFSVGDMTIHRIVEQEQGFTPLFEFLPTLSKEQFEENRSWMEQGAYDAKTGNVVLCFQSYVVKTPHHNILVDACIGNNKTFAHRPSWHNKSDGNWMAALKAAGLGGEDTDFVMWTHLHGDQH